MSSSPPDSFATTTSGDQGELISGSDNRFWRKTFPWLLLFPLAAVLAAVAFTGGKTGMAIALFPMFVALIGVWLSGSILRSLCEVRLTPNSLLISDFSTQVEVPLAQIAEVRDFLWMHVGSRHPVEVTFEPGAAVALVRFLPIGNPPFGWTAANRLHPTVVRLRELAAQKRAAGDAGPFST